MVDNNLESDLRPLVTGWLGKIEQAIKAKKPFTDIAEQCTAFFSADTGFMWEPKYRKKYLNTSTSPRFRMTMSKAFELVALFGPTLYWRNPTRTVTPRRQVPIPEDIFGPENMAEIKEMEQGLQQQMQQVQQQMQQSQQQMQQMQQQMQQAQAAANQGDQEAAQALQQMGQQSQQLQQQIQPLQQQSQQLQQQMQQMQPQFDMIREAEQLFKRSQVEATFRKMTDSTRAELMQKWLNYTPNEQPGGGLAQHAEMAITEALVKGRGVLWVQPYTQPGSEMNLTASTQ
jgi:DNA repair exonuclease SbcCD ATPase subunit